MVLKTRASKTTALGLPLWANHSEVCTELEYFKVFLLWQQPPEIQHLFFTFPQFLPPWHAMLPGTPCHLQAKGPSAAPSVLLRETKLTHTCLIRAKAHTVLCLFDLISMCCLLFWFGLLVFLKIRTREFSHKRYTVHSCGKVLYTCSCTYTQKELGVPI